MIVKMVNVRRAQIAIEKDALAGMNTTDAFGYCVDARKLSEPMKEMMTQIPIMSICHRNPRLCRRRSIPGICWRPIENAATTIDDAVSSADAASTEAIAV